MKRLVSAESLIQNAKRKFLIFSIVGVALVVLISFVAIQYHKHVIENQSTISSLSSSIDEQVALVYKVIYLATALGDDGSDPDGSRMSDKLQNSIAELNSKNAEFVELVHSSKISYLGSIKGMLAQNRTQLLLSQYLERASLVSSVFANPDTESTQEWDSMLNRSLVEVLSSFEPIRQELTKVNETSLTQLNRMGFLLVSLCFLEIILIWVLVFKPVYVTLLAQHEKLSEAVIDSVNANRSRAEFLANISHEIRTPMTAILGYADILQNSERISQVEKKEAVRIINQNASHLLSLIDEVLDVSKIESGKMTVEKKDVNLPQLLSEVYSLMNVRAQEKGLQLRFRNRGLIPRTIESDPKRMKQILLNLINNSIKFTEKGRVELLVSFLKKRKKNCLVFLVSDTGCGISTRQRKRLFRPFEQGDASLSRDFGGAGLGLVLSRGLARQMGGDVTIEDSEEGVGTTFRVDLDAGVEAHFDLINNLASDTTNGSRGSLGQTPEGNVFANRRILVVDDAKENAKLFEIYLSGAGAIVDVANGGSQAITLNKSNSYDAILLDIQMPGKDGYQVLNELRGLGFKKPIIALTAHAMADDRKKTKEAGFDGHISKPVSSQDLVNIVHEHIEADPGIWT